MMNLEHYWYRPALSALTVCFLPLSFLFRSIVAVRRFFYRIKIFKTYHFDVPIIVIGNITVGGTGKTPLTIWLADFLKSKGLKIGIVSRGVGGKKQRRPIWVTADSNPKEVGDEAVLLAKRTHCPIVIGIHRVNAVNMLLKHAECDVIITDDGLQHYRLGRDIEIALIDEVRALGNQQLLPSGPLREPPSRLRSVDFIIRNGQTAGYSMQLTGTHAVSLLDENKKIPIENLKQQTWHAIAGIGHPARFFSMLRSQHIPFNEHIFKDHYLYQAEDFKFSDTLPIIMTEKDAVKCKSFADERFWYVPVDAQVDQLFQEALWNRVMDYL